MSVTDLNRDQLIQLKMAMLTERLESPSYGELANADAIITDGEVLSYYDGYAFSSDDFF